jgi:hypothetical protein
MARRAHLKVRGIAIASSGVHALQNHTARLLSTSALQNKSSAQQFRCCHDGRHNQFKLMREPIDPYRWMFALTSLVQFALFLRWLYRRIRNEEMTRAFVEDMATNHLPQVYRLLEQMCEERKLRPHRVPRSAGLI